jgi:hypothetical protein
MAAGICLGFAFGLLLGAIMTSEVSEPVGEVRCFDGGVVLRDFPSASAMIVGESIICGRDWHISGVYGPNLEDFSGPITFREFRPE